MTEVAAADSRPINRAVITACVILAVVMQALDTTIANVALPYMQGSVSASADQINWVLTSYIVAAAIMTPPSGFLANRFGRRRVLMAAVTGFVIASVLCGIAQSLVQIVAFRLLQGFFGAALVPVSQSILLDIYTPEERRSAMALFGVSVMVGPVLGPVIGGWLTDPPGAGFFISTCHLAPSPLPASRSFCRKPKPARPLSSIGSDLAA